MQDLIRIVSDRLQKIDSKLDGNSNIPMQRVTKKYSVPNEVAAAQNESLLEFEKENVADSNVEQMRSKDDSESIKVSSASVSWILMHQKSREFEKPVFISDYRGPRTRPPVNNIGS